MVGKQDQRMKVPEPKQDMQLSFLLADLHLYLEREEKFEKEISEISELSWKEQMKNNREGFTSRLSRMAVCSDKDICDRFQQTLDMIEDIYGYSRPREENIGKLIIASKKLFRHITNLRWNEIDKTIRNITAKLMLQLDRTDPRKILDKIEKEEEDRNE